MRYAYKEKRKREATEETDFPNQEKENLKWPDISEVNTIKQTKMK